MRDSLTPTPLPEGEGFYPPSIAHRWKRYAFSTQAPFSFREKRGMRESLTVEQNLELKYGRTPTHRLYKKGDADK